MNAQQVHDFGLVDDKGDVFEFTIETADDRECRFVAVMQTERGPRRTEVANIPVELWTLVATAAVKELVSEMREGEREKKAPTLRTGVNRLSPLVGRELGVLLIVLMEEGAPERVDALLHAWRELAREERWWLYSKAAAPGQRLGAGWRRALFHALSETSETRSAPPGEKKKLWEHQEALIAKNQHEDDTSQPAPNESDRNSVKPSTTQEQRKNRRGKNKSKKPPKDKAQIDLF